MVDLTAEFAAMRLPTEREEAWLAKRGVPLDSQMLWPGPVCTAMVATFGRWFEPSRQGHKAFVHPVWCGGEIGDLVAWRPAEPAIWWIRGGDGRYLGGELLAFAAGRCLGIAVAASPLDWLRRGGNAVMML